MAWFSEMTYGLTVKELADLLDPPLTPQQVIHMICLLGLKPCGYRRSGQRGRPAALYEAKKIMAVHAVIVPYIPESQHAAPG